MNSFQACKGLYYSIMLAQLSTVWLLCTCTTCRCVYTLCVRWSTTCIFLPPDMSFTRRVWIPGLNSSRPVHSVKIISQTNPPPHHPNSNARGTTHTQTLTFPLRHSHPPSTPSYRRVTLLRVRQEAVCRRWGCWPAPCRQRWLSTSQKKKKTLLQLHWLHELFTIIPFCFRTFALHVI